MSLLPLPQHIHISSPSTFPPEDTFVTTNEAVLTHYYPKSIAYLRVHSWHCTLWVLTSVQWYVSITMTCIHHCSIAQNKFTVLKVLCALPIYLSWSLDSGKHWSFYCLHCFAPTNKWVPVFPHPYQHLVFTVLYATSHSNRCVIVSLCFNFLFLSMYDMDHFSISLFDLCISSLLRYLLRSLVHF